MSRWGSRALSPSPLAGEGLGRGQAASAAQKTWDDGKGVSWRADARRPLSRRYAPPSPARGGRATGAATNGGGQGASLADGCFIRSA